MNLQEKSWYAERRELEGEIKRLNKTVNELAGKLNRSPDWKLFNVIKGKDGPFDSNSEKQNSRYQNVRCFQSI